VYPSQLYLLNPLNLPAGKFLNFVAGYSRVKMLSAPVGNQTHPAASAIIRMNHAGRLIMIGFALVGFRAIPGTESVFM